MYKKILALKRSDLTVFDIITISNLLNLNRQSAAVILQRLKNKSILLQLKRNKYVLAEDYAKDLFKIANELVKPSYISMYSALNYFGASTQSPLDIQSVTVKRGQKITNPELSFYFQYYQIKKELYFGYQIVENKFFAEKEKALLDLMYYQKKGLDYESINFQSFDKQKLKENIQKYPIYFQKIFFNNIKDGFGYDFS